MPQASDISIVLCLSKIRVPLLAAIGTVGGLSVSAQTPGSGASQPPPVLSAAPTNSCNPWVLRALPDELTFRQRVCLGLAHLTSPVTFLAASATSGYGQWRNNAPRIKPLHVDDYGTRLGYGYERQTARATAELLAGYLHHEDPRARRSNGRGFWQRSRFAFVSVLDNPDRDGHARIALLPIAGALGSGLTSMAVFPHQNTWADGFERSGSAYGFYFARAFIHEFSPELWSLTPHFIRKHKEVLTKAATL